MGRMSKRHIPDLQLLFAIIALLIIGILMVYSSSALWAQFKYDDSAYFLKRQLFFAAVGIFLMYLLYKVPLQRIKEFIPLILGFCFILLVLVLIPGIGMVRGGAQSWIGVGIFSIQPAEFIKLGLILYIARYLAKEQRNMHTFFRGFLLPNLIVLFFFSLIMLQPDLGTGIVLVLTCIIMIFVAGARFKYFVYFFILGLIGFILLILSAPYRISRITAYLNPWDDPLGDGFQIIQSLYAIGPGKLLGVGYGNSLQKQFYLPEPQTDFIFAILSEELGFLGGLIVILLFYFLCYRGLYIAYFTMDAFTRYVAIGIVTMLTVQCMINLSVVIGLIPITGITLPFLSYGGSSLTLTLVSIGILLNISKFTQNHY